MFGARFARERAICRINIFLLSFFFERAFPLAAGDWTQRWYVCIFRLGWESEGCQLIIRFQPSLPPPMASRIERYAKKG